MQSLQHTLEAAFTQPSFPPSTISFPNNEKTSSLPRNHPSFIKHPDPPFVMATTAAPNECRKNVKAKRNRETQKKNTRKKSFRSVLSSLIVFIRLLSVSMLFVAVNSACTGSNPQICDPLPNGNGEQLAAGRIGSLGSVVDDFFQTYAGQAIVHGTKAQVIAKYGPIETWDTSQVTNMAFIFHGKSNINPDIRNWRVDRVVTMDRMFMYADSFNIDLSSWVVSKVMLINGMFNSATAYTQTLCGNTWIESIASGKSDAQTEFRDSNAKIGTEPCSCSPGKYLTTATATTPKTCKPCTLCTVSSTAGVTCLDRTYQDEVGYNGTSCTKECSAGLYVALDKSMCVTFGSDPLPNGNGLAVAELRIGSLGGVVDNYFSTDSATAAQVIAKYGSIETWDTSQVTNTKYVFHNRKNINPDIKNWRVDRVVDMSYMFQHTDIFNIDLSKWIVSSVTNMDYMFYQALAYTQTLCGNTWIESGARNNAFSGYSSAKIGTEPCSCSPGKYLTTTNPKTCTDCTNGKYQDKLGFTGSSCTKQCSEGNYSLSGASSCDFKFDSCPNGTYSSEPASCVSCGAGRYNSQVGRTSNSSCIACSVELYIFKDKSDCIAFGSDPLPNGNNGVTAAQRAGYLGGVVDDMYQHYNGAKPSNSMSTAQVIAKYGSIETWDVSRCTNMARVFMYKKNINPDIQNWRVDSVVDIHEMFQDTNSFNIDLSSWTITSVTIMYAMFWKATAYDQNLCGNTWIDSTASKGSMFAGAGSNAKIGTEYCSCGPGRYLTTSVASLKYCASCPGGKYQDKEVYTGLSCTSKECPIEYLVSSVNKSLCIKLGSNVLPNHNGKLAAAARVGFLGGLVDDYEQDYHDGNNRVNRPSGAHTRDEVIAMYGQIENWNLQNLTTTAYLFYKKSSFNNDIRSWIVNKVTNMTKMFYEAKSFAFDLSPWNVNLVTTMDYMFAKANSFIHILCGNTWVNSNASKINMFEDSRREGSACAAEEKELGWIKSFFGSILPPWVCKKKCQETAGCKFYSTRDVTGCMLYSSCDNPRSDVGYGAYTTYQIMIGKIGDEPCSCNPGHYLDFPKCFLCKSGKYQNEAGFIGLSCTKNCSAGKFSDIKGLKKDDECKLCSQGKWSTATGITLDAKCSNVCSKGKYSDEMGLFSDDDCKLCSVGRWSTATGIVLDTECNEVCPGGKYSDETGLSSDDECKSCFAGKFNADESSDWQKHDEVSDCIPCKNGEFSKPGSKYCEVCTAGKQQINSTCSDCIPGQFSTNTGTDKNENENENLQCQTCPSGFSQNYKGQQFCLPCSSGTFSTGGESNCTTCKDGKYRSPGQNGIKCYSCNSGLIPNEQKTACQAPDYKLPSDCKEDEYLNTTASNKKFWGCVDCPSGGYCKDDINETGVGTLFGWSKCPNLILTYERCSFGAACLGAPNPLLEGKYVNISNKEIRDDPATKNQAAKCGIGYQQGSLLCAACASKFSHSGLGDRCDQCPKPSENNTIAILGSLGGIIGLYIYIQITLSDKGKIDPADGAKSIGLSYIQVISLLSTFPIAWPDIFISIFKIGGAVAVLGQHLVNLKCMYPKNSEAEVFYTTRIIWAILPVALPLICAFVWLMIHLFKGVIDVQAKIKASITALLYLIWPGLCSETFALFSCRDVCGKSLLRVDLEEECGVGRHFIYSRYLGIPMLIVYVIGLPLIAFIMVILVRRRAARRGAKIETSKGHLTFGLFYSAYDPKIWWWEITVTFRKIFVAYIGVFGGALGEMQVHLTAYVMFVVIVLTCLIQPFGKNILLHFLEVVTLAATWMTLWAGTVFNMFPRCEDDKGIAVGWCNALSIFIGLLNIAGVVAVIVGFIYYKQQKRCNACGKKVYDEVIVAKRRRTMETRQIELRTRMSKSNLTDNPFDTERQIEMSSIENNGDGGDIVDESGLAHGGHSNPLIDHVDTEVE